jgi:hypothetical protein
MMAWVMVDCVHAELHSSTDADTCEGEEQHHPPEDLRSLVACYQFTGDKVEFLGV